MLCPVFQLYLFQGLLHPLFSLCFAHFLIDQGQLHIFLSAELGDQVKALKHKAYLMVSHPGQLFFRVILDGGTIQQILAAVCNIQAADDVHQRGFATARRAGDADKLPRIDVQAGVVQRPYRF